MLRNVLSLIHFKQYKIRNELRIWVKKSWKQNKLEENQEERFKKIKLVNKKLKIQPVNKSKKVVFWIKNR